MPRYIPGVACLGRQLPNPQCIGAVLPDVQAVVDILWSVTGQEVNAQRVLRTLRGFFYKLKTPLRRCFFIDKDIAKMEIAWCMEVRLLSAFEKANS